MPPRGRRAAPWACWFRPNTFRQQQRGRCAALGVPALAPAPPGQQTLTLSGAMAPPCSGKAGWRFASLQVGNAGATGQSQVHHQGEEPGRNSLRTQRGRSRLG